MVMTFYLPFLFRGYVISWTPFLKISKITGCGVQTGCELYQAVMMKRLQPEIGPLARNCRRTLLTQLTDRF